MLPSCILASCINSFAPYYGMCAGISAIGLNYGTDVEPEATSKLWHALVASTSGTNIRLRVCTGLAAAASVLTPPLKAELQQRLTALDIGVAHAHEIAVVHSLTALRHLWLCDHPESGARLSEAGVGSSMRPCQMSSLRTLQLHSIAPGAFFIPGSAASLQHLHKLRLIRCPFPDSCLPSELLRLPALRHFEIFNVTGRLLSMPDLRGLSALRSLVVYKGPRLRSLCGTSSAELEASLTGRPLCGATGLTRLCLSSTLIDASRYADAIERLPQLKVLHVDYSTCNVAAFYAAKLQRQLRGRCSVRPATKCRALDWLGDDW